MDPLEDDFCDVLTKAMRGLGLSPEAVARLLGVEPPTVQGWMRGSPTPNDRTVAGIAEALGLSNTALLAGARREWHPQVALPSCITRYVQAPHVSNGYVLHDGGENAVVDPAGDPRTILNAIAERGGMLRYILITHRHDDHCDAAEIIHEAYSDARLLISATELGAVQQLTPIAHVTRDGEIFPFANGQIIAQKLPGHTDGLMCYRYNDCMFVGDALFAGSLGRNFGPKTTYREQLHNALAFLTGSDPHTIILPGHGPPTTVGLELSHNPFFANAG